MDAGATEAAITLEPAGARGREWSATCAIRAASWCSPGRRCEAGVTYQLDVAATATDIDHQPLVAGAASTFTTAGMSPGPHVVVLAAAPGEGRLDRARVARWHQPRRVSRSRPRRCSVAPACPRRTGCGVAAFGAPLYTYAAAALSPGRWLARGRRARRHGGARRRPCSSCSTRRPGPWSRASPTRRCRRGRPTGRRWPSRERRRSRSSTRRRGSLTTLARRRSAGGAGGLEPARRAARPRCRRHRPTSSTSSWRIRSCSPATRSPASPGASSDPAISPDGTQLAFLRSAPGAQGTWIAGIGASPTPPEVPRPVHPARGVHRDRDARGDQPARRPAPPPSCSSVLRVMSRFRSPQARRPARSAQWWSHPRDGSSCTSTPMPAGIVQAYVENADGSDAQVITDFAPRTLVAASVAVSG